MNKVFGFLKKFPYSFFSRTLIVGVSFFLLCHGSFKLPITSTAENFKETFYLWIISKSEEKNKNKLSYMALEIPITNI